MYIINIKFLQTNIFLYYCQKLKTSQGLMKKWFRKLLKKKTPTSFSWKRRHRERLKNEMFEQIKAHYRKITIMILFLKSHVSHLQYWNWFLAYNIIPFFAIVISLFDAFLHFFNFLFITILKIMHWAKKSSNQMLHQKVYFWSCRVFQLNCPTLYIHNTSKVILQTLIHNFCIS